MPSKRAPINLFTVQCIADLLCANRHHDIKLTTETKLGISAARNRLAEKYLDADYILWIDTDMMFRPNSLKKLLDCNKDIVSGLYFSRGYPFQPLASHKVRGTNLFKPADVNKNGLIEVDAAGFGFMLIKKGVFDKIEKPWFVYKKTLGEDYYFCTKAKEAGFKVFVNCDVQCGHWTERAITINDWNNNL